MTEEEVALAALYLAILDEWLKENPDTDPHSVNIPRRFVEKCIGRLPEEEE